MPIIKLYVDTGYSGANHNSEDFVDDEEWAEMSPELREELLQDMAVEYLHNCIDYGAYVEDEE